jgi:hypothetical protein
MSYRTSYDGGLSQERDPRGDPTELERAIKATIAGAILGIVLAVLGRPYPEK